MHEFSPNNDIIASTEIAQAIGMHPWEIASNPERTAKFNDIVGFMAPFSDKTFILQKLTRGMMKDEAIEHVWRYVGLRKEHMAVKEKYQALENELKRYE